MKFLMYFSIVLHSSCWERELVALLRLCSSYHMTVFYVFFSCHGTMGWSVKVAFPGHTHPCADLEICQRGSKSENVF